MTSEQKLQWVAVPGGVLPDGRLTVTAMMSPRLRTDEGITLAVFPDLLDWPATVGASGTGRKLELSRALLCSRR